MQQKNFCCKEIENEMEIEKMYYLTIKTIQGKILNFKVKNYELKEGHVEFFDEKTGLKKSFPAEDVNIDEVDY